MILGGHWKIKLLFLIFLSCFSQNALAQITGGSVTDSLAGSVGDSLAKRVEDSLARKVIISDVRLIGNKVTHPRIINRELIFMKGDTMSLDVLTGMTERSRENLMNTQLFNFVEIDAVLAGKDKVEIIIIMTERWYIFPIPIFEVVDRNFNEWWKTKSLARTVYGLQIKWENFRGRNESVRLSLRFGYTENFSIYYNIPYLDKEQKNGLTFYAGASRNHEVSCLLTENKIVYYKNTSSYIKHDYLAGLKFYRRGAIYNTAGIFVEYRSNTVSDTVVDLNYNYFKPGYKSQQFFNIGVQFKRDRRDFVEYPLKGYYFDVDLVKQGIGIFSSAPEQIYLVSSYRKYFELSRRWHFATGIKGKVSGTQYLAFYNSRALGYNADFVRGYEYYVINGQNFMLFKSNLKFSILPVKVFHANYIPSEKFSIIPFSIHLNGYVDAAYVHDRQFAENNPLANSFLLGYGLGLDFVTYYNIIIRTEYSFNKMGENGLFIHFAAPI